MTETKPNSIIKVDTSNVSKLVEQASDMLKAFELLDQIAERLMNSDYARNFERVNKEGKNEIFKIDIINNMIIGSTLGISPMESVMMGKKLNPTSYGAIKIGQSLGLDPNTAMSKIFGFSTSAGTSYALSAEVYSYILIKFNVKVKIIEDYAPVYKYYPYVKDAANKSVVGATYLDDDIALDKEGKLRPNIYVVTANSNKTEIDLFKANCDDLGLPFINVARKLSDRRTSIRFTRESTGFDEVISFSIQEAIDAELYPGLKSDGTISEGKDNWRKYPRNCLRARVIAFGCRLAAPEKAINTTSVEEAIAANYVIDEEVSTASSNNDDEVKFEVVE